MIQIHDNGQDFLVTNEPDTGVVSEREAAIIEFYNLSPYYGSVPVDPEVRQTWEASYRQDVTDMVAQMERHVLSNEQWLNIEGSTLLMLAERFKILTDPQTPTGQPLTLEDHERMGFDHDLCQRLQFHGTALECYGHEKTGELNETFFVSDQMQEAIDWSQEWAQQTAEAGSMGIDVNLSRATFYGDMSHNVPLAEAERRFEEMREEALVSLGETLEAAGGPAGDYSIETVKARLAGLIASEKAERAERGRLEPEEMAEVAPVVKDLPTYEVEKMVDDPEAHEDEGMEF